ncbi:MAG TPA: phosphate ABC transporter substrate-binding protein PstS [Candidatus Binataceae bacterium]|nr:phosphate ABC transporter substrate-binding protein PstS [Candidatus Binataceae bacterium]
MSRRLCAACCLALIGLFSVASAHAQMLINGAGSTFGYPIYSKWFDEYAKVDPSVRVNYQSIGSGGGIMMLRNKTIAIGATDAPLTDDQVKKMPGPVLEFPSVLGAIVMMYDIPGVKQNIRLTGPVIADIYLGKVTKWNDPAIAALNPGVNFPDAAIVPTHRSEGSGTTYIFSDYLSKISPQWTKLVGRGMSLKWPAGLGGKGSEGVTGLVEQTPGAIGYVELTYALANNIPFATIKNRNGAWIAPSLSSVTDAAADAASDMPADFRVSITDAPGSKSYPISSFTWLVIYKDQPDQAKGQALIKLLRWALTSGQQYAAPLHYAPLPKAVVDKELAQLKQVNIGNKRPN